ncbi:MAG: hypothetical protein ACNA8W_18880, partial [Bradymonadaceae bacterium]
QSEEAKASDGLETSTDYEKLRTASAKASKKGSNPALIVVGVLAIAAMLFYTFVPTGGGVARGQEEEPFSEMAIVEVKVDCLGEAACLRQANASYRLGVDLIEKRDIENRNLFDGYMRLLETKALLEAGGITEVPADMDRLDPLHDQARADLDLLFSNFRMRYHQLNQKTMYREMADVLNSIQAFFPDRTARENRWAVIQERKLRARGNYPRDKF